MTQTLVVDDHLSNLSDSKGPTNKTDNVQLLFTEGAQDEDGGTNRFNVIFP
jgi:hypothetical protein